MSNSTYNSVSWTVWGGYTCGCGAYVPMGQSHICPNLVIPTTVPTGYTCTNCGTWVLYGYAHHCTPLPPGWQLAAGPALTSPGPDAGVAEPEARPESPLAALAADLRDLLGKAAGWLSERKL